MNVETGKTLEQLWYENSNHLPMAVMWFSGGYSHDSVGTKVCKTEQRETHEKRAVVLRFIRRFGFFGPVVAVVMRSLAPWRNPDGTYTVRGKTFVNHDTWHRACYYRIGKGFYRDSTEQVLDMWRQDYNDSLQAAHGEARLELDEGRIRAKIV